MDPLTIVVTALVTGLTAGLTETATSAIKDTYAAFKARLQKKVEGNEDAQIALKQIEKQPDSKGRQEMLNEELQKLEVQKDTELVKLAQDLLDILEKQGRPAASVVVNQKAGDNAQQFGVVHGDVTIKPK